MMVTKLTSKTNELEVARLGGFFEKPQKKTKKEAG